MMGTGAACTICIQYLTFFFSSKTKREIKRRLRRMSRYCGISRCTFLVFFFTMCLVTYLVHRNSAPSPKMAPPTSTASVPDSPPTASATACWPAYTCLLPEDMHTRAGNFDRALGTKANDQGLIYLAIVDMAVIDLATNLYESSFKRHDITNILFVCIDQQSMHVLAELSMGCYDFSQDWNDPKLYKNMMQVFKKKTHMKTKVALSALVLGYTIVMTDVDMVFVRNPYLFLVKHLKLYDIQLMHDAGTPTTAFYVAKPTGASIKAHTMALELGMAEEEKVTDRHVMIIAIFNMSRSGLLKFRQLDPVYFQDGKAYFETGMRMFYSDNPCRTCVAVHNNWVYKKQAKIYRMKENLMWLVDQDGYYSSPWTTYVLYSSPVIVNNDPVQTVHLELETLRDALTIAFLLKRVLILPGFHCGHCQNDACQNINRQCALNTYIDMHTFHTHFKDYYREHVFLSNPQVPDAVRMRTSRPILIQSEKFQFEMDLSMVKHKFIPKDPIKGAEPDEITGWFGKEPYLSYAILNFHSLYGAFAGISHKAAFKENRSYRDFQRRLMVGLREVDYRQAHVQHNDILKH